MTMTEAMREQFEAWFASECPQTNKQADEGIIGATTSRNFAFKSYQAALRSPAVAGLVEALRKYMNSGIGNSTDFYEQAEAYNASLAALAQYATLDGEKA